MKIFISGQSQYSRESEESIVSLFLYDYQVAPAVVALEYSLPPQGMAWTVAGVKDKDFYKILEAGGIANYGAHKQARRGTASLLCVPQLGRGASRWFYGVASALVETDEAEPLFLIRCIAPDVFEYVLHDDPRFLKLLSELWPHKRPQQLAAIL